jgi:uncharacterized membrane-anchored protein
VLLSVVGTLITDNLTDNFGVPLVTTTIVFSVVLAVVFSVWYAVEKTLSIHSITTIRREVFYWLAVLFTFALGTAAGDLISEKLAIGYFWTTMLFATLIAAIALAHWMLGLNAVLAFWSAYILTRPLGASIGDLLGQHHADGGMGIGKLKTSVVFLPPRASAPRRSVAGALRTSGIVFAVLFAIPLVAQSRFGAPEVAMFWTAYIITRPLGASFADWLALPPSRDGIGLGTGLVTVLWGVAIAVLVSFLALTRRDVESDEPLLG